MFYQMRLPFPRGPRVEITCGHTIHYSRGMCEPCYYRDYREKHLEARQLAEAKSKAKKAAARRKGMRDAGIRKSGKVDPEGW